jgi:circadian clock protein KaiB
MSAHLDNSMHLPEYVLRLFVTGNTRRSVKAVENIRRICEEHLKGRYGLEVIDIYQQPELAAQEQLLAAPTLVKSQPLPIRRMVGDMANEDRVLVGLGLGVVS